jgi:hypothetical protein
VVSEHLTITGFDSRVYLGAARAQAAAMRANGQKNQSRHTVLGGTTIDVRIQGSHTYIKIDAAAANGFLFCTVGTLLYGMTTPVLQTFYTPDICTRPPKLTGSLPYNAQMESIWAAYPHNLGLYPLGVSKGRVSYVINATYDNYNFPVYAVNKDYDGVSAALSDMPISISNPSNSTYLPQGNCYGSIFGTPFTVSPVYIPYEWRHDARGTGRLFRLVYRSDGFDPNGFSLGYTLSIQLSIDLGYTVSAEYAVASGGIGAYISVPRPPAYNMEIIGDTILFAFVEVTYTLTPAGVGVSTGVSKMYRSTDAGTTCSLVNSFPSYSQSPASFAFITPKLVAYIGAYPSAAATSCSYWLSTDGGVTWGDPYGGADWLDTFDLPYGTNIIGFGSSTRNGQAIAYVVFSTMFLPPNPQYQSVYYTFDGVSWHLAWKEDSGIVPTDSTGVGGAQIALCLEYFPGTN